MNARLRKSCCCVRRIMTFHSKQAKENPQRFTWLDPVNKDPTDRNDKPMGLDARKLAFYGIFCMQCSFNLANETEKGNILLVC